MARRDISDKSRTAFQDDHRGWLIEVAAGYSIETDDWLVHAYVTRPGGEKEKIAVYEPHRHTFDEAVEHGFDSAVAYVDHFAD
ncbi:hypothetical protein [Burkholderia cenocepacia]|uniref:hypothetical protein n=1 Tax=Burkholderia cenocepacia TaxID=95486 RepID=UPI001C248787|nr:hypothetical protein [Burkholderia cenocepacia]